MSLNINVDDVIEVLLADGWHKVLNDSFDIDAYEYSRPDEDERWGYRTLLGGGQYEGITAVGAIWEEENGFVCCPVTAILAIRRRKQRTPWPTNGYEEKKLVVGGVSVTIQKSNHD